MPDVTLDHFKRAAADIGAHGDNDTLPFDIDVRFVKENPLPSLKQVIACLVSIIPAMLRLSGRGTRTTLEESLAAA